MTETRERLAEWLDNAEEPYLDSLDELVQETLAEQRDKRSFSWPKLPKIPHKGWMFAAGIVIALLLYAVIHITCIYQP